MQSTSCSFLRHAIHITNGYHVRTTRNAIETDRQTDRQTERHVHARKHARTHTRTHARTTARAYTAARTHAYARTHLPTHAYARAHMPTHIRTYIHVADDNCCAMIVNFFFLRLKSFSLASQNADRTALRQPRHVQRSRNSRAALGL